MAGFHPLVIAKPRNVMTSRPCAGAPRRSMVRHIDYTPDAVRDRDDERADTVTDFAGLRFYG